VKEEYSENTPIGDFSIFASDVSSQSIRIARKNIASARMMKTINLEQTRFEQLNPRGAEGILIFNPPYNVRIEVDDMIQFYQTIGNHLKHTFMGHQAWIISSDTMAIKHVGLKPSQKFHVMNGQLESRFHGFDMY
jgi:putative N6-adenine-specific DNA methylase